MATNKTSPTAGETKAASEGTVPSGTVEPVIAVNGVEPDTTDPKSGVETTEEDIPKMSDLGGIRYVGIANVKTITKADLEILGVEEPKGDLIWDASNGKVVSTKEFNAATRDVLLGLPDFVVA
ncbi:hypothetical protein SEA_RACHELLA_24 [Microbacterium phage Rachella]|uniref:Uncharacterized protein n=5 Tax=Krampusvirus krampus TaxID=2734242 RepID=A0A2Z4Q346_9CAUD|nr:hypothetical protein HOT40_gp24 [Microbacterium phage Krampus]AWY04480.1 hypothetical protein SEA_ANNASERENA_24 [Microbacterium phage AnnaSerena]QCQ57386.1 hypothetical protein SEA_RACHELLA_24 [Microbacterium phage Rachella]QDF18076.1 hypothetical protein SEA_ANAKIN_24 [Microbacterium phage Anakin]QDF18158.1 hypothetical protein SEA_NARUTORUN_24 [Microbacterium phage NarutoRun]UDG78644.1 hypothetical protein SEA_NEPTUNE_24 [Microbacterium phage Neptune]UDL15503.1 hypothetical protein SEA_C